MCVIVVRPAQTSPSVKCFDDNGTLGCLFGYYNMCNICYAIYELHSIGNVWFNRKVGETINLAHTFKTKEKSLFCTLFTLGFFIRTEIRIVLE